jgi:hypothetical protein
MNLRQAVDLLDEEVGRLNERAFPKSSGSEVAIKNLVNDLKRKSPYKFMHRGDKIVTLGGHTVATVVSSGDGKFVVKVKDKREYRGSSPGMAVKILTKALKEFPGTR